jgi:hypothetical protein
MGAHVRSSTKRFTFIDSTCGMIMANIWRICAINHFHFGSWSPWLYGEQFRCFEVGSVEPVRNCTRCSPRLWRDLTASKPRDIRVCEMGQCRSWKKSTRPEKRSWISWTTRWDFVITFCGPWTLYSVMLATLTHPRHKWNTHGEELCSQSAGFRSPTCLLVNK